MSNKTNSDDKVKMEDKIWNKFDQINHVNSNASRKSAGDDGCLKNCVTNGNRTRVPFSGARYFNRGVVHNSTVGVVRVPYPG